MVYNSKKYLKGSAVPKYAVRYEILRGVSSTSRKPCSVQPSEKPIMVGFLLDEKKLFESGGLISHQETIFLDSPTHDWDWRHGMLFYYGRAIEVLQLGNIVAIFQTEDREAPSK